MSKLITNFFEAILNIAAFMIIVACFIAGMTLGSGGANSFIIGAVGAVVGLFISAIFLGVPLLLFRINKNLEMIQTMLNPSTIASDDRSRVRIEPR